MVVVDDNPNLTKIVARTAEPLGLTTKICNDPDQAFDAFIEFEPGIIMVDMCMPEKNGLDVPNEILLAEIPVKILVTSGHGQGLLRVAEEVARFHASPDVASVCKPFRRTELVDVLTRLMA